MTTRRAFSLGHVSAELYQAEQPVCCLLTDLFFPDVKFLFSFCCVGVLGVFMALRFSYEIRVAEFSSSCILRAVRSKSISFLIVSESLKGSRVRKEPSRNDPKGKTPVVKAARRMIAMTVATVSVEAVAILAAAVAVKRSQTRAAVVQTALSQDDK